MVSIQSFIKMSERESSAMCDTLSGEDRFWAIINLAGQGKMSCQEIGYEILSLMEAIDEHTREMARANGIADNGDYLRKREDEDEHASNPGAA